MPSLYDERTKAARRFRKSNFGPVNGGSSGALLGLELFDQRGGGGEEDGTAADGGAEGLAEVAEGGVTDFHGGLGHIMTTTEEEIRSAFHADLADILRNGHAHFLGEKAAQVKGAATDLGAEGLDIGGIGKMSAENGGCAFDAFLGNPLLALAEKFLLRGGLEKDLGEEFEGLGLVPERVGDLGNRWLAKGLEGNFQAGRHDADIGSGTRLAGNPAPERRVKRIFERDDLGLDVRTGKFDGDEGVGFVGGTLGEEVGVGITVEADGMGREAGLGFTVANNAVAAEIEAEFKAVLVEAAAPVDGLRGKKFVVLDADALVRKRAVELSPAFFYLRPSAAFVCHGHNFSA